VTRSGDGAEPGGPAFSRTFVATLLLTLINVFNYMDRMALAATAQPLKESLGLTDTQLGLLTGFAFVALYAAIMFPLARLADRIGRRVVLASSLAFWSLATTGSGLAHSFSGLLLARVGVGMGEAGCVPSSQALLAELYPPRRRATPVAVVASGSAVGTALGLGLGGLIAGHYGWRNVFLFLGPPGVVLALVVGFMLPEPPRLSVQRYERPSLSTSFAILLRVPTYRRLLCALPFYQFVAAGIIGWLPVFFVRSFGMSVQQAGLLFGLAYGVGIAVGGLLGAHVLQVVTGRDTAAMLRICGYLMWGAAVIFAAALLSGRDWLALVLLLLFGLCAGGASAPIMAALLTVIDERVRAQGAAVALVVGAYLGLGLGPLLVGWGSERLNSWLGAEALRGALLVGSTAGLLAGWFLWSASRSFAADAMYESRHFPNRPGEHRWRRRALPGSARRKSQPTFGG
jgi:MFS family permease